MIGDIFVGADVRRLWAFSSRPTRACWRGLRRRGHPGEVAGVIIAGRPARWPPSTSCPGLPADRLPRPHALAKAATQHGDLDVARLVALGPEAAAQAVQELPGIGSFYSQLIFARACGFDELYGITTPMTDEQYASFAVRCRPYRTWAVVLVRAAAHRLG